jgi:hypothetical protein
MSDNIRYKSAEVKAGFQGLHPKLRQICSEMADYCAERGQTFLLTETVTTAAHDQALARVSDSHQEGRAVDIRTRDWTEAFRNGFMKEFTKRYGAIGAFSKNLQRNFLVYHDAGNGAHIHAQIDRSFTVTKKETP